MAKTSQAGLVLINAFQLLFRIEESWENERVSNGIRTYAQHHVLQVHLSGLGVGGVWENGAQANIDPEIFSGIYSVMPWAMLITYLLLIFVNLVNLI